MPPTPSDQVRLARLDAKLWEDSSYAYIQHEFYGWQTAPQQHFVWRRAWKPIGQGGFGAVFSEECIEGASKGSMRAVKSLQKPSTINSRSIDYGRELEAIARFSRPEYAQFFVQSSGWYEDSQAVFIVMELVSHGNLQQHIGLGLSEIETTRIVRQVLQGLSCMHREGYTHRDMKPQVGSPCGRRANN